jgi:ligand-binding SRPBCC domain-containing protein
MRLLADSWVSAPRDRVFPFFMDAGNLQALTPPWLHFEVLTPPPLIMRDGLTIVYRIRLHGVPLRWTSLIAAFDPPRGFVDRQIAGPYRHWTHTHRFFEERGGTRMTDQVDFDVPFRWLAGALVARELKGIFTYRHEAFLRLFDEPPPWPPPAIVITR